MGLLQDAKWLAEEYENNSGLLSYNREMFEIFEGDLLCHLLEALKGQLNERAFEQAQHRAAPINFLRSLVDKLSRIYNDHTIRRFKGTPKDIEMLEWYAKQYRINVNMQLANEYFNMFKNCAPEPFFDDQTKSPGLRIIPSERFFVCSKDVVNPMRMTHFVKIMGKRKLLNGRESTIFFAFTSNEFLIFDDKGEVIPDLMANVESGPLNPYGVIPNCYIVRSNDKIMPNKDTDLLSMTKLIPVLLTDINYAVMFQCFSIVYGIDVDDENLKMNPNAFWRFKSDPAQPNAKPQVGIIKPEVDSDKVISLCQTELALFLQSRNIRPGAVGQIGAENFQNGISKMIDEMDTSADRKKQVPYFQDLEQQLWTRTIKNLHPVWSQRDGFKYSDQFSDQAEVEVIFPEQRPDTSYTQTLDDCIKELKESLTTRKRALKKLNPDMEDTDVDQLIAEIEEDKSEKEVVEVIQADPSSNPGESGEPPQEE